MNSITGIVWIFYITGNGLLMPASVPWEFKSEAECQAAINKVKEKPYEFILGPGYELVCRPKMAGEPR